MDDDRYSRQSFLGPNSQRTFESVTIGIAGLGGGGSHIAQQAAHLGFLNYELFDPQAIDESNLNRTVGARPDDVKNNTPKVKIAERIIRELQPTARVRAHNCQWQDATEFLNLCDILFTCLDGFDQRRQIEAQCRRYLIPIVDIGLGVHGDPPYMAGQIIVSMPGYHCMKCLNFLSDKAIQGEAAQYGNAGPRPQVVWSNGVLASTAVGLGVDILTDWTKSLRSAVYLDYRANSGSIAPHERLNFTPPICPHFPLEDIGPVMLRRL